MDDRLARIMQIVDEQANDEALWFTTSTAPEEYVQKALRRLHAAIEAEDWAVELYKNKKHDS